MAENLTRQILSEHLVDGDLKPREPVSLRLVQGGLLHWLQEEGEEVA